MQYLFSQKVQRFAYEFYFQKNQHFFVYFQTYHNLLWFWQYLRWLYIKGFRTSVNLGYIIKYCYINVTAYQIFTC